MNISVCIPIYKTVLDVKELRILNHSLKKAFGHEIFFAAPETMDISFYGAQFPDAKILTFKSSFFQSERTYSQLLLQIEFYERFSTDFLLVLQTDALIFRDNLDYWASLNFDYIGAPWAGGIDFPFATLTPSFSKDFSLRPTIGNGGLSLRKVSSMKLLLNQFKDQARIWASVGNPEDVFFGMAAQLTPEFLIPNFLTAARFSIETFPSCFLELIAPEVPFGCHAFDRYEPDTWRSQSYWPKEL